MSTVTPNTEALPLVIPYQPARWSVADYHKLIADGTLTENHRLELLRGVMVEKMPSNPEHANLILALQLLLSRMLPTGFLVRSQLPVTLRDSEPEPDISIARGELNVFWKRHPGATELPLVIEASSSSLLTDRYKAEIYAEAGIPWYWIVNLQTRRVEVYSQPTATADGLRYGSPKIFQPGDAVPVILDGQEIGSVPASQILPPDSP